MCTEMQEMFDTPPPLFQASEENQIPISWISLMNILI